MAIRTFPLDGTTIAFEISEPDGSLPIFSLNTITGEITSAHLPAAWLAVLEQRALVFFEAIAPDERARGSFNFLQRFVNVAPLDDSTLGMTSVSDGDVHTLIASVSVVGANAAHLLVQLPHSIGGAAGMASALTSAGGAVTALEGHVRGFTNATYIFSDAENGGPIVDAMISNGAAIKQSKIAGLELALASKANASSLSAYLTTAVAEATYQVKGNYLTSADLSPYLTTADAAATYQLKGDYLLEGALAGYLTSADAATTYIPQSTKRLVRLTADLNAAPADWATVAYAPVIDNATGSTSMQAVALASALAAVSSGIKYKDSVKVRFTSVPNTAALLAASLVPGDRYLLDSSTTAAGIYVVGGTVGTPTAGARAADLAIGASASGIYVFVTTGTDAGKSYLCNNTSGSDVVNTAVLTFVQYNASTTYSNGDGLSLSGTTFSVNSTIARLASPTFTGTPLAPTATAGTNTTQIATTAFVTAAVAAATSYTLTPATSAVLGGVIVPSGSGLSVDGSGNLSAAVKSVVKATGAPDVATSAGGVVTVTLPAAGSAAPQALGTASAGSGSAYALADHVHPFTGIPYDVSGEYPGVPAINNEFFHFKTPRAFKLGSKTADHQFTRIGTGTLTAATAFTVWKNGTQLGTVTFNTNGTITIAGNLTNWDAEVSFIKGDMLMMKSGATVDANLDTPVYTFFATLA